MTDARTSTLAERVTLLSRSLGEQVCALEAEAARLRIEWGVAVDQLAIAEQQRDGYLHWINHEGAEAVEDCARLREQLAEASRDTARLDAMLAIFGADLRECADARIASLDAAPPDRTEGG